MQQCSLCFLFLLNSFFLFAQKDSLVLELRPVLGEIGLEFNKNYAYRGREIRFDVLKFYISQIQLSKGDSIVWSEVDSYRLVDLDHPNSLNWAFDVPKTLDFDKMHFQLGIDSLTHEAGVMGGDLDPTRGMYWAWNTGYINLKVEGHSALSTARDGSFQFHLGGYMPPFQSVMEVVLPLKAAEKVLLYMDISKFMDTIDLEEEHKIMSPGKRAQELSNVAAKTFSFDE